MKDKKSTVEKNRKIIIDLDAENVIDFKGNLGVTDTLELIKILNDLSNSMLEHLVKVTFASTIKFGQECASRKEMEQTLSRAEASNLIQEMWE